MKTYCLTLHDTPEITANAKVHFAERGVDAEFIYGIHGQNSGLMTKNPYEVDNPGSGFNMGPKHVSIWANFIMVFQVCLQQPDEHFFVVEHDAQFDDNWKSRFDQGMLDVPRDFDFFFIGSCCLQDDSAKHHIQGEVWKVYRPFCNHACVINKKCLPFVIKTLQAKCWAPLDIQLIFEAFPQLKVYALLPRAVHQFNTVIIP